METKNIEILNVRGDSMGFWRRIVLAIFVFGEQCLEDIPVIGIPKAGS